MKRRHWRDALRWLAATLAALALFRLWPGLDLGVSAAAFDADGPRRFPFGEAAPVQWLYLAVPWLGRCALLAALVLAWRSGTPPRWRRRAQALLLALVLGLWGVVNIGLKDHWGRPRPTEVSAFGGPHPFQPAGRISAYCDTNCAFVSGHAATGFTLMAVGLLGAPATRRRWGWIGLVAGVLIGTGRVLQGGHFLSDIVFAGLAMQGVCLLVRAGWVRWRLRHRGTPHNRPA
jgi:membrane-associated phospholipid phosphatase